MTFAILTDSTADLPLNWLREQDVIVLGLTIQLDGLTYETVGEEALTSKVLLERMSQGSQPTTSQVNVGQFVESFCRIVESGRDVLYLAFSAALSGTYQSALIARELVLETHPNARIEIVDTKAATMGEGYLVMKAVEARVAGYPLTDTIASIEEMIPRLRTYLMVDDLQHLVRGGRLSKTAGLLGGLVNIKPILSLDRQGHLVPKAKLRGKKKAIREMVGLVAEELDDDVVIIVYTGDESVTVELKESLLKYTKTKEVLLAPLGPVIAAHTGMGTLAVLFVGKTER